MSTAWLATVAGLLDLECGLVRAAYLRGQIASNAISPERRNRPGRSRVACSLSERYKTDQGDAVEQYNGAAYHGQSYEHCKQRLHESFQAYKACVRY